MSILTPVSTLSFPVLFTPKVNKLSPEKPPQYSAMLTFPKTEDISVIQQAIIACAQEKFGANVNLHGLKMPIKDGDQLALQKGDPWYAGKWVLSVSATQEYPPQVLNEQRLPVVDKATIYAGCKVVAAIRFYGYDVQVNKGIGCGLIAVMKVGDGDRLDGGTVDAAKLFANVQVELPVAAAAGAVAAAPQAGGLFGGAAPQGNTLNFG